MPIDKGAGGVAVMAATNGKAEAGGKVKGANCNCTNHNVRVNVIGANDTKISSGTYARVVVGPRAVVFRERLKAWRGATAQQTEVLEDDNPQFQQVLEFEDVGIPKEEGQPHVLVQLFDADTKEIIGETCFQTGQHGAYRRDLIHHEKDESAGSIVIDTHGEFRGPADIDLSTIDVPHDSTYDKAQELFTTDEGESVDINTVLVIHKGVALPELSRHQHPYVVVCDPDMNPILKTSTAESSTHPMWNRTFRIGGDDFNPEEICFKVMTKRKLLSDKCIGIATLETEERVPGDDVKLRLKTEEGQLVPGASLVVSYEPQVARTHSKDFDRPSLKSVKDLGKFGKTATIGAIGSVASIGKKCKQISFLDISDEMEEQIAGKPPQFKLPFWMNIANKILPRTARQILDGHPGGVLKVTIDRAHGLVAADTSVFTLGMGSASSSDPYVSIYTRGRSLNEVRTQCVPNTLCPYWNEEFEIPIYHPGDDLVFDIFDRDVSSNDDNIGNSVISLRDLPLNKEKQFWLRVVCTNDDGDVVTGGALNVKLNFISNASTWRWSQIFSPLQVPERAWEPPRLNINDLYGKAIVLSEKFMWMTKLQAPIVEIITWKRPIMTLLFVMAYEAGMFNVEYAACTAMLAVAGFMLGHFCMLEVDSGKINSTSKKLKPAGIDDIDVDENQTEEQKKAKEKPSLGILGKTIPIAGKGLKMQIRMAQFGLGQALEGIEKAEAIFTFQSKLSPYVMMALVAQAAVFYFVHMKFLLMAAGAGIFFATAPGNVCIIRFFIACLQKPHATFERLFTGKNADYFTDEDDPPDDWLSEDYHRIKAKANS